jgi:D-glycero-alpha-D-manno-heptose-7-phosphate kinase
VALGYSVKYNLDEAPVFDGVLDLAKAAIQRLSAEQGMELDVRSDAPPGSGLGGSSAVTSAVIGAVASHMGKVISRYELAELNYTIERTDLRIAGGKQDQYATTFGGFNLIEFYPDRVIVNPLRIESDIIYDLEAHLMLCYTGRARSDLGLIDKQVRLYNEGRQETITGMKRLYEMVFELKDALLTGKLQHFGSMLNEAYLNKKRMNPDVATGTIADELYGEAMRHGALGGKLLGAGGGGYLLLYCEVKNQYKVRAALEAMGGQVIDFTFDHHGLQSWRSRCQ